MKGDGKKKENKRSLKKPRERKDVPLPLSKRTLKKPRERKDVPLPSTLPSDLKPYDTNNDGVLDDKERRIMELKKKMQEQTKAKRRRQ